ncbi:14 kDa proline-rich protein DC2.15 [Vitis vinifera]|uniref:14 kDa proline-rich protein DC2.15 n=1 Tax=Vitis vinifera TaxID=29760 RepID=A0A438E974_VITVI|nr:14 kDa proline-rich protein DC2.15 [Vitis vinifera]
MASKVIASTSLLMSLNLLFFTLVSSNHVLCPQPRENPRRFLQNSPATPTCSVGHPKVGSSLDNLVDLEAAVCLCMIIKANILGINLSDPVALSLLLNYCGKNVPSGFQCA